MKQSEQLAEVHFPARFSLERFTAWRWRATNLGSLALNYRLADQKRLAIVNSVDSFIASDSDSISSTLDYIDRGGFICQPPVMMRDTIGYTMHVAQSRRSVRHWLDLAVANRIPNLEAELEEHNIDPGLADHVVVMGLMNEVPTYPSQFTGKVGKNNQTIVQPYLLEWVDQGTQDLVRESLHR